MLITLGYWAPGSIRLGGARQEMRKRRRHYKDELPSLAHGPPGDASEVQRMGMHTSFPVYPRGAWEIFHFPTPLFSPSVMRTSPTSQNFKVDQMRLYTNSAIQPH